MSKLKKMNWLLVLLILLLLIYLLFWLKDFGQFDQARATYNNYQQLLESVNYNVKFEHPIPNPFIWQLQKQTLDFKRKNSNLLKTLEQELQKQKQELLTANDDLGLLENQLTVISQENISSQIDDNEFKNLYIEDFNRIVTTKKDLQEKISERKSVILSFKQEMEANNFWINPLWGKTITDLENLAKTLTISEQAGQLLMFVAEGQNLEQDFKTRIQQNQIGNLIFMANNIADENQTKNFTSELQKMNPKIPLILATDQEGGVVKRIIWDDTPGQTEWVEKSNEEIYELAKKRATVLKTVGINVNLSPVVDLSYPGAAFINNRTISSNPNIVSEKTNRYVAGLQNNGVIATLKHFPGHGSTLEDSHNVLPAITKTKTEWLASDALPFIQNEQAQMLMAGHLLFTSLDPSEPATQSKIIIDNILRSELGYTGVVITDDLKQLISSTHIEVKEALKKAYLSGIDLVLYITTPEQEAQAITALKELITSKEIPEDKLVLALVRILRLKSLLT